MKTGILLSGGLDSIALMYWKKPDYAFTINYGQRPANAEMRVSAHVAEALSVQHFIISVDCSSLGSGDLSKANALDGAPSPEWWPFRNQMLITLACMKGISLDVNELMVGSVKSDGFHIDGTKEFFDQINQLSKLQEGNISVTCPAIELQSEELILKSGVPEEILFWAHSCHTSNEPCGSCRGCYKYLSVLQKLGFN